LHGGESIMRESMIYQIAIWLVPLAALSVTSHRNEFKSARGAAVR